MKDFRKTDKWRRSKNKIYSKKPTVIPVVQLDINQELFEYIGELENQVMLLSKEVEKMKSGMKPSVDIQLADKSIAGSIGSFGVHMNEPGIKPV